MGSGDKAPHFLNLDTRLSGHLHAQTAVPHGPQSWPRCGDRNVPDPARNRALVVYPQPVTVLTELS